MSYLIKILPYITTSMMIDSLSLHPSHSLGRKQAKRTLKNINY